MLLLSLGLGAATALSLTALITVRRASRILAVLSAAILIAMLAVASNGGTEGVLVPALVLALAVVGGGPVVLAVYDIAFRAKPPTNLDHLPATAWIGFAERFVFTLALLLGLGEVAAVVLGVKALGQYTAADNTHSAHRVLGTLVSAGWALTCYGVVYVLRHHG